MIRSERAAVNILRLIGVGGLCAAPAVVMPFSWMAAIHSAFGLGELPETPIVEYLARSLSAFYAFHGIITLFVSFDFDRYRRVIRLLAALFAIMGFVLLGIDLAAGMPLPWTLGESISTIGTGAVLLWLLSDATDERHGINA